VRRSRLLVLLAGGLDVCSGVRTAGWLDPQKLTAFMAEISKAG